MKQEMSYINWKTYEISIEAFDELEGEHKFSKEYQQRKKKMLREYRRDVFAERRSNLVKVAIAASLLIIAAPLAVNAATDGEFFNRIWGNLTQHNIKAHKEVLYDEQAFPFVHTFPEREYVKVDLDRARELLDSHVYHKPIIKKLGDTTLTILSSVHDGNAAIVEFKLEREGEVNAFEYSQLNNEYRGAEFSQEPDFWFHFPTCSEHILVDLEKSTKEVLYCYDYMVMEPNDAGTKTLSMEVQEYPCSRGEMFEADSETFDKYVEDTKTSELLIPLLAPVKKAEYVNKDNGAIYISPLSMRIDMEDSGLGIDNSDLYDSDNVYYVCVNYKNKASYIVQEHELDGIHACETPIDNSSNISADEQGYCTIIFNRLVDIDDIASITVNKTTYRLN